MYKRQELDWDAWFDAALPLLDLHLPNDWAARDSAYVSQLVLHAAHAAPADFLCAPSATPDPRLVQLAQACFFAHRPQAAYFCEMLLRFAARNTLGFPRHLPAHELRRHDRAAPAITDEEAEAVVRQVLMCNEDALPSLDPVFRAAHAGCPTSHAISLFLQSPHLDECALAGYESALSLIHI